MSEDAADSSKTNSTLSESWRKVAGTSPEISPSTAFFIIGAFFWLQAISIISLALNMVPIPIVMALVGTFDLPPKSRDASLRVKSSSVTNRVPEFGAEPGSLKPMWPVRPIPNICKSRPPNLLIFCSYAKQNWVTSSLVKVPSGMFTFALSISIWLNKLSYIKVT